MLYFFLFFFDMYIYIERERAGLVAMVSSLFDMYIYIEREGGVISNGIHSF